MEYTFIDAVTGALIGAPPRPAKAVGVPFQGRMQHLADEELFGNGRQ